MAEGFYKELIKKLKANGCIIARQGKGSHEICESPLNGQKFPVPFNIKYRTLANVILKQAGIMDKI